MAVTVVRKKREWTGDWGKITISSERDAGKGAICAGGRPLKGGVCDEGDSVFDSMIFASGKNAGMALEDSRRKNKVKGILWRSLRSRREKRKRAKKEARWGDPIEIFFYRGQAVLG